MKNERAFEQYLVESHRLSEPLRGESFRFAAMEAAILPGMTPRERADARAAAWWALDALQKAGVF